MQTQCEGQIKSAGRGNCNVVLATFNLGSNRGLCNTTLRALVAQPRGRKVPKCILRQ